MRIPRLLQAFIPFGILDNALDTSRSKKERMFYGGLFAIFVLAVIGFIVGEFSGSGALGSVITFVIVGAYACIMIFVMLVGGRSTFRMGKNAQGFSKVGYRTLGVLCIIFGILLIVMVPYSIYTSLQ